jgi:DNA topoisomerase I
VKSGSARRRWQLRRTFDCLMRLAAPTLSARHAELCYTCDARPGITRKRRGKGFAYFRPDGRPLRRGWELARVQALAIPPAWERVWICPRANGHLQATGYDVRGRKQYRYHADWSNHRNLAKFEQMLHFGQILPAIRRTIDRDMAERGMQRAKVAACIIHVMDESLIRVGNAEYARDNNSYGLTTIHNHHAQVRGDEIRLKFRAKGGKPCDVRLESPRAARIVRRCQELPGQELFAYVNGDGIVRDMGSEHVNEYLLAVTGDRITAKDFRTWGGTVIAAEGLEQCGPPAPALSARELKRREVIAVKAAAEALGNTPATCRKYYIHPRLLEWYASGALHAAFETARQTRRPARLALAERALLTLLKREKARPATARTRRAA